MYHSALMYINCRFNRIAALRTASCPNPAMIAGGRNY